MLTPDLSYCWEGAGERGEKSKWDGENNDKCIRQGYGGIYCRYIGSPFRDLQWILRGRSGRVVTISLFRYPGDD